MIDLGEARPAGRLGALWVVATPIGHLDDLSIRAGYALAQAEVIACEDTRRTSGLLRHLGVTRPRLVVLNDHTERSVVDRLVGDLVAGCRVVLVSDAGTPAVSDPGWRLIRAAIDAGVEIDMLPGPVAAVAAAVVSGLPVDRFCFDGFLPRSGGERSRRLAELATERRTTVLYEAPHRLARTIEDLAGACDPDRSVVIARELTKLHQEVWRGTLAGAIEWVASAPPRGEIVVVLGGAPELDTSDDALLEAVGRLVEAGSTRRDAVEEVARVFGVAKRRVFDLANG